MGGNADLPQRSSSPLKRRASSMDPDTTSNKDGEDVEMGSSQNVDGGISEQQFPRAMSVDAAPQDDLEDGNTGRHFSQI